MNQKYSVSDKVFYSRTGTPYVIIGVIGKSSIIRFLQTGAVKRISNSNIPSGKVKDVYAPTRYGVGYLGEYQQPPYWSQAMQLWSNMIKRCYSDVDPKGYKRHGTTVDANWQCFARFLVDLPEVPNFDKWVTRQNYQLDKDLLFPGANVYSRETCQFIPEALNKQAGKLNKRLVNGQWVTITV